MFPLWSTGGRVNQTIWCSGIVRPDTPVKKKQYLIGIIYVYIEKLLILLKIILLPNVYIYNGYSVQGVD